MTQRRDFITGVAGISIFWSAGCLGDPVEREALSDDGHLNRFRGEISDREVQLQGLELNNNIVEVEHSYDDDPNDAIANVAMAFVERIAEDWDVERLDGHLNDEGNDWTWHAEAEWAQAYADGEIDPDEYGSRLSETMAMVTEEEA